ncbi:uncharacterized protein LOC125194794 [Salvia hispanica]|uniref:uncharacterized protein LOC125194794 n=1 Tax=Salvia hispanica TaxID=49212 RepID=UPI0020090781|nr:uncharacterized protein LOC125194794 [Salvia hispanica]
MESLTLFSSCREAISSSLTFGYPEASGPGIRRRLSSLSLNLKIQPSSPPAAAWAMRRPKSISAMGEYAGSSARKWWEWGWGWILTRKPTFAADLEMNEEEVAAIGSHSRGSWPHVFYKLTPHLRPSCSAPTMSASPDLPLRFLQQWKVLRLLHPLIHHSFVLG